jgi:hypothetical protein
MASTALFIAILATGVGLMLVAHFLVIFWALRRGACAHADQEDGGDTAGPVCQQARDLAVPRARDFFTNGAAAADCAVCQEAFEAGNCCRRLPRCEHSFQAKCVDPWLGKSRCCQVCRANVVA